MAKGRLTALLIGGVIGAGVALLLAPRSGKETRAFLADKAEEMWGEGADFYSQNFERVKAEAANVQRTAVQANEELRAKIENARSAIADQIAKNAQSAREAINAQIPLGADKITQEADVVKGQIDEAADQIKSAAANLASQDAAAVEEAADAVKQPMVNPDAQNN